MNQQLHPQPDDLQPIKQWTTDLVERCAIGATTIWTMGHQITMKLDRHQRERFEEAKKLGFVIARSGYRKVAGGGYVEIDLALRNVWYHWCEATNHPYVTVTAGRSKYTVTIDMIANDWELDETAQDQISDAFKQVEAKRKDIALGRVVCHLGGVMYPNEAVELAVLLVAIAQLCKAPPDTRCAGSSCTAADRLCRVGDSFYCPACAITAKTAQAASWAAPQAAPTEPPAEPEIPVLLGITRGPSRFISAFCPACWRLHLHGRGEGHRVAHCTPWLGELRAMWYPHGYDIKVAPLGQRWWARYEFKEWEGQALNHAAKLGFAPVCNLSPVAWLRLCGWAQLGPAYIEHDWYRPIGATNGAWSEREVCRFVFHDAVGRWLSSRGWVIEYSSGGSGDPDAHWYSKVWRIGRCVHASGWANRQSLSSAVQVQRDWDARNSTPPWLAFDVHRPLIPDPLLVVGDDFYCERRLFAAKRLHGADIRRLAPDDHRLANPWKYSRLLPAEAVRRPR